MLIAFMILAQLVLILALIMFGSQLRWLTYVLSALSVATALHLITRPDKYAFKILWTFLILLFPLFGGVMRCKAVATLRALKTYVSQRN